MNYFKLGYNFDLELIGLINKKNDEFKDKSCINEVFGSIRKHAWLAARPDFRLPDVEVKNLGQHVNILKSIGVTFNYTLNTIFPGGLKELSERNKNFEVYDLLQELIEAGIKRVTIANPIIAQEIRNVTGDHFEIEISTVAHIDNVSQIQYLHEQYNLKKVCIGIHKNRSFRWLKAAADYANRNNIELEILANEFCGNGGKGYSTHCTMRDSCYLVHATTKELEETELLNGYPMQHCIASRDADPVSWLRSRFVRPQDLHYYNDIGINKFKLSGRTGSTEYLSMLLKAYMSGEYNDNLLKLWKPLETIKSGQNELDFVHDVNIPTEKLDGFLDKWTKNKSFECANVECGKTCTYCDEFYNKIKDISNV